MFCRTPVNSSQAAGFRNTLWKVVQKMGWSVQWWEMEMQSLVFNRGYTHRKVTAFDSNTWNNPDVFILQKEGDMNNDSIVTQ